MTIEKSQTKEVDSNRLLSRAGFLQQAYSGVFHLLPLGLRVQGKLERLIDKHMRALNASRVSLSSFSSQDIWARSGRLATDPDLFKFEDRKGARWLLSPTHEEEITSLVSAFVYSQRDLPIRLYQISRKYRDEPRPRQGLLRSREFLMKDLYTFDVDSERALSTYAAVSKAYCNFFDELKLPYVVAKADSGNMGGSLSHEYHFPSLKGEDDVVSCSTCNYSKNEEVVNGTELKLMEIPVDIPASFGRLDEEEAAQLPEFVAISKFDRRTLIKAYAPVGQQGMDQESQTPRSINPYAIKAVVPDIDLGFEEPQAHWENALNEMLEKDNDPENPLAINYLFDRGVGQHEVETQIAADLVRFGANPNVRMSLIKSSTDSPEGLDLVKAATGDPCPQCQTGLLKVQKAIEVGHTFHLGTRYSDKLGATVTLNTAAMKAGFPQRQPIQMGCHGIGVSRLIAAIASSLADSRGLNWPRAVAPFQAVVIPRTSDLVDDAAVVYDRLTSQLPSFDAIIDDRPDRDVIWKLKDADLIGFPVIVVVGKGWKEGKVEIQCRRLGRGRQDGDVPVEDAPLLVEELLAKL